MFGRPACGRRVCSIDPQKGLLGARFAGHARIEASDDLGIWRTVVFSAPIENLHAGDARIIERRVELSPTQARYWRLSWPDTPAPFELTTITAEPARDHVDVTRETVTVGGRPIASKRGEFEFDLAGVIIEELDVLAVDAVRRELGFVHAGVAGALQQEFGIDRK